MKLSSLILSFVVLVQSIGLSVDDMIQVDEFIEHAQFHNKQYGDNLLVFISKHYGELKSDHEKAHEEEKSEHEKLPFQHSIHLGSLLVFSLVTPQVIELKEPELYEHKSHQFIYQELYSPHYLEGVFQPPKHS
jgi:hypothetical protein